MICFANTALLHILKKPWMYTVDMFTQFLELKSDAVLSPNFVNKLEKKILLKCNENCVRCQSIWN